MAQPHIQPLEIVLTKEVAEALQSVHRYNNPATIYNKVTMQSIHASSDMQLVSDHIRNVQNVGETDHGQYLMQLLTGHYQVVSSPEEQLHIWAERDLNTRRVCPSKSDEHVLATARLRTYADCAVILDVQLTCKIPLGLRTYSPNAQAHKGNVPDSLNPVTVTQAEVIAVQELRKCGHSSADIIKLCTGGANTYSSAAHTLKEWVATRSTDDLVKVLAGVYRVEYTKPYALSKLIAKYQATADSQIVVPRVRVGAVESIKTALEVAKLFEIELPSEASDLF